MKENQLNKKQKEWLEKFLEKRPYHHYRIFTILAGTRSIEIEWTEETNITILDNHTYIATQIKHKLTVVLRFSGHPIKDGKYSYDIIPPQRYTVSYSLDGQLSLDIPQYYEVQFPENPVVVKHRVRKPRNSQHVNKVSLKQHKHTLNSGAHKLQDINYKLTGTLKSEEELLEISTLGNIKLPTIIINMLHEKDATEEEFILTHIAFKDGGVDAALNCLNTIEQLRNLKKH